MAMRTKGRATKRTQPIGLGDLDPTKTLPGIAQFSHPRSGSTLVYNILLDLFPGRQLVKLHTLFPKRHHLHAVGRRTISGWPVVTTYRHPIDAAASLVLCHGKKSFPNSNMRRLIHFMGRMGLNQVPTLLDNPNVLLLRYEDFFGNFEVIYDGIELHLGRPIAREERDILTTRYQPAAVSQRILDAGQTHWDHKDNVRGWHGNHVSKYGGQPGNQQLFSGKQLKQLRAAFADFMSKMGYE